MAHVPIRDKGASFPGGLLLAVAERGAKKIKDHFDHQLNRVKGIVPTWKPVIQVKGQLTRLLAVERSGQSLLQGIF